MMGGLHTPEAPRQTLLASPLVSVTAAVALTPTGSDTLPAGGAW